MTGSQLITFKSIFILLLFSAIAASDNNDNDNNKNNNNNNNKCCNATTTTPVPEPYEPKYEHVILINGSACSDNLVLQQGNVWVLVKADFSIDSAKCWNQRNAKDEFAWDKGIAKVSFPQYQTMLMFLENVDHSFAGQWNCLFLGKIISQPVSCAIKVEVGGAFQSASVPTLKINQSQKQAVKSRCDADVLLRIGITVAVTSALTFIIVLAAVIIYCKTKIKLPCNRKKKRNDRGPARRPIPEEPVVKFENKPISDRTSNTSENIYECEYVVNNQHAAGLVRTAPLLPQRGTRCMTIRKP